VLWFALNPNRLVLNKFFFFQYAFRITFPKGLVVVDNKQIGHKFWGNLGSFTGFGKAIIFVSFQDLGKEAECNG
jgi:hypothetical protein